jgi:hypothetical protein
MNHSENQYVFVLYLVHDHELTHRKAAHSRSEFPVARPSGIRKIREKEKTICDAIDEAICNLEAATVLSNLQPDIFEVGFGAWSDLMRH